jgi:hypothetical protein
MSYFLPAKTVDAPNVEVTRYSKQLEFVIRAHKASIAKRTWVMQIHGVGEW